MTTRYPDLTAEISRSLATMRRDQPAVMQGFGALAAAAMKPGALDAKSKELIALAIGVAGHCAGCIGFHVQALVRLGATRAEVEEALAVAVYMGGGPSLMYTAEALQAWEEFSAAAAPAGGPVA